MNLNQLKFIDLFAGIGGFHQALTSFGAQCVFASEWDKFAAQTYYANYQIMPAGDITQINEADIPAHDILCAGFPCQAFSISGKQRGFEDTRGTLFFDIARIVAYHRPKILLLENVKNLIKHNKGNTLNTILVSLKQLGYDVSYQLLNASHFGVAQNRERVYFVGFRQDLKVRAFQMPKPSHKLVRLQDLLEQNPAIATVIRSDIQITKPDLAQQELDDPAFFPNRPLQIGFLGKGGQGERIYHPAGHAITLSAYGGGVGAKTGLYQINGKIRKLTPRECARLQGFPEDFKIISSTSQAYQQFGNSVAIPVIKAILAEIAKATVDL